MATSDKGVLFDFCVELRQTSEQLKVGNALGVIGRANQNEHRLGIDRTLPEHLRDSFLRRFRILRAAAFIELQAQYKRIDDMKTCKNCGHKAAHER